MNVSHLPLSHAQTVPLREDRDWLTGPEISTDTGVSYRRIDYWTRTGLLTTLEDATPGTGFLRRYPEDQLDRAIAIRDLLAAGVTLQTVRRVLDQLLADGHVELGPITLHHAPREAS